MGIIAFFRNIPDLMDRFTVLAFIARWGESVILVCN